MRYPPFEEFCKILRGGGSPKFIPGKSRQYCLHCLHCLHFLRCPHWLHWMPLLPILKNSYQRGFQVCTNMYISCNLIHKKCTAKVLFIFNKCKQTRVSHSVGLGTTQCARDKEARQSIWFLNWGHLELFCLLELELLVWSPVLWKADDLCPLADVPWLSRCWWSPSNPIHPLIGLGIQNHFMLICNKPRQNPWTKVDECG